MNWRNELRLEKPRLDPLEIDEIDGEVRARFGDGKILNSLGVVIVRLGRIVFRLWSGCQQNKKL